MVFNDIHDTTETAYKGGHHFLVVNSKKKRKKKEKRKKMPHCNLLSLLGAAIVFISCSLHCCQAHSRNLVNKDLCRSLDVQHELLDPVADDSVVVQLTNASGAVATCYQKSTIYNGTLLTLFNLFCALSVSGNC